MSGPVARAAPRYAAGRARSLGVPTRGTTAPNRLRRVDRWLLGRHPALLLGAPLLVDVGFGESPVTTEELWSRVRARSPQAQVIGVESDPQRVATALARPGPGPAYLRAGFDLTGVPGPAQVIRAFNVLRQYPVEAVRPAWAQLARSLHPGGVLIEGTCDELGRRAVWCVVDGRGEPRRIVFAAATDGLERPSDLAERLPKVLIEDNVAGSPVNRLFSAWDRAWAASAGHASFSARQRWAAAADLLRSQGWPVLGGRTRWRLGELELAWSALASEAAAPSPSAASTASAPPLG